MGFFKHGVLSLESKRRMRRAPVNRYELKHFEIVKELIESVEPDDRQEDETELLQLTKNIIHRIKRSRARKEALVNPNRHDRPTR